MAILIRFLFPYQMSFNFQNNKYKEHYETRRVQLCETRKVLAEKEAENLTLNEKLAATQSELLPHLEKV